MRKIRFSEHQIIAVLKSVEAGRTVKDMCRDTEIFEVSFYNWKTKYGGMEAVANKKIKNLEDENRSLMQMFADLSLECMTLSLSRTVFRYQPYTRRDEAVFQRLTEAAEHYPRYGFKKLFQVLRRQVHIRNHKWVHRIYCLLILNFPLNDKQRLPVRNPPLLTTPEAFNQSWSIDFMHEALTCG